MKLPVRLGAKYLAPTFIIVLVLVVAALSLRQPKASASPPPPDVPDFKGEPFTAVLDQPQEISYETVEVTVPQEGWQTILDTDFEDVNWDADWTNLSATGDWYKYGTRAIANALDPSSTNVAWAVGTNPSGEPELNPAVDGYPIGVDAWLRAGPYDLSDVIDAKLAFEYDFDADVGDKFAVGASTDNVHFEGTEQDGGTVAWSASEMDLSQYAGQPQVWILFRFTSDNTPNSGTKLGLLLDNIKLHVEYSRKAHLPIVAYGFTPTPDPTPTRPVDTDYRDDFTDTIVPWAPRIWTLGSVYNLTHDNSSDGNRQGFLNLLVTPNEKYVIVSPMVMSEQPPYNIEIEAKIRSPRTDLDQYAVIFGANKSSDPCPAADFSTCFTNYYEMRVRYRDTGRKYMEFKLKRIDGHDENNQNFGPDLIKWTDVDEHVDEEGWVEWDVKVESDGKIRVTANGNFVGEGRDNAYLNNPYFGLEVRTGDDDSSEVRFDYFKID
jgi:hypothetical protein